MTNSNRLAKSSQEQESRRFLYSDFEIVSDFAFCLLQRQLDVGLANYIVCRVTTKTTPEVDHEQLRSRE
jgi:hypothetical protein